MNAVVGSEEQDDQPALLGPAHGRALRMRATERSGRMSPAGFQASLGRAGMRGTGSGNGAGSRSDRTAQVDVRHPPSSLPSSTVARSHRLADLNRNRTPCPRLRDPAAQFRRAQYRLAPRSRPRPPPRAALDRAPVQPGIDQVSTNCRYGKVSKVHATLGIRAPAPEASGSGPTGRSGAGDGRDRTWRSARSRRTCVPGSGAPHFPPLASGRTSLRPRSPRTRATSIAGQCSRPEQGGRTSLSVRPQLACATMIDGRCPGLKQVSARGSVCRSREAQYSTAINVRASMLLRGEAGGGISGRNTPCRLKRVRARRPSRMDISGLETRRRHIPVLMCLLTVGEVASVSRETWHPAHAGVKQFT